MALSLTRLAVLAAGAGAVWYGRKRLAEGSEGSSASQAPSLASSPPAAPAPAAVVAPPVAEVAGPEPSAQAEVSDEPEIEPREVPDVAGEPPPAAFEDAHQQGWQDEELGKDPAALDELASDPATEPDLVLEGEGELPEPPAEPEVAPPTTAPGHVTRVVDDLLEGRRDDAEAEPIEDAPLVEEDPQQP